MALPATDKNISEARDSSDFSLVFLGTSKDEKKVESFKESANKSNRYAENSVAEDFHTENALHKNTPSDVSFHSVDESIDNLSTKNRKTLEEYLNFASSQITVSDENVNIQPLSLDTTGQQLYDSLQESINCTYQYIEDYAKMKNDYKQVVIYLHSYFEKLSNLFIFMKDNTYESIFERFLVPILEFQQESIFNTSFSFASTRSGIEMLEGELLNPSIYKGLDSFFDVFQKWHFENPDLCIVNEVEYFFRTAFLNTKISAQHYEDTVIEHFRLIFVVILT